MKKKILLIFFAIIIGILASVIYELKVNELWIFAKETEVETVADADTSILVINPDYYNPLVSSNIYIKDLSKLVFEGLTRITDDLNYENCLAKIIEPKDDYKTYRIVLKDNIKFHNGDRLTSDDIIYTINQIQNLKEKSIYYYNIQNIKSIKKINNEELKVELNEIDNFFPAKLDFPILSELTYSNKDLNKIKEYNGTGRYKVVSQKEDEWILEYNNDYREEKSGHLVKVSFQKPCTKTMQV